jgi:hypothetical protein
MMCAKQQVSAFDRAGTNNVDRNDDRAEAAGNMTTASALFQIRTDCTLKAQSLHENSFCFHFMLV